MGQFVETCMRVSFTLLNFLYFWIGVACLATGIWVKMRGGHVFFVVDVSFYSDTAFVAVGIAIALISFLGVCSVGSLNLCCLACYATLLTLLLIAELGLVITGYVYLPAIHKTVERRGKHLVQMKYPFDSKRVVDKFQKEGRCCGFRNYTDWRSSHWHSLTQNENLAVPVSCCLADTATDCNSVGNSSYVRDLSLVYTSGCGDYWRKKVQTLMSFLVAAVFVLVVLQLLGVTLTCFLMNSKGIL